MPYFIPNKPGVFATEDEALAAALPNPPEARPVVHKDKSSTKAPAAPQED